MKNYTINLEDVSLARILAEINKEGLSGFLEIKQDENKPIIKIWFIDQNIVAVTGNTSLIEKIQYYNWLKPQLVISLLNETLRKKAIGEKLLKVYNLKVEQIKQLFQDQIKDLYNLFALEQGTVKVHKDYQIENFPYAEMTGYELNITRVISQGLKQNIQRYLDDFPETCLTIKSTSNSLTNNLELESTDLIILKFADSNKTIKQIAKESKIPIFELQQTAYFLQLIDKVDFSLSTNRLLELTRNSQDVNLDHNPTNFEYRQNWKVPLVAISCLNLFIIIMTAAGFLVGTERKLLSLFFRWRGTTPNQDITIVTVSDQDIERFPSYPIADEYLAQALQNIKKQQPIVIGLDIYRNIAQPPGHEKLLDVYRNTDNLIGIKKIVGNKVSPAPRLAAKNQVAFSDLIIDSDNIVRRSLMSMEDEQGNINLSLGAYLALFTLSQENIVMGKNDRDEYILGQTSFQALDSHSDGYWRATDFNGLQTLLNHQHRTTDFHQISFWDVYQDRIPKELIHNKIVLIGVIADSEKDFVYTSFSKNKTGLAEPIPGVVIHANITAQLLNAAKGEASMLKVFNKYTAIALIIGFSLVGIVIGILSLKFHVNLTKENQNQLLILQGLLLSIGVVGISYVCFLNGLWIPTIASMVAASSSSFAISSQYKQQLENLIYADKVTKTANRKYFDRVFNRIFNNAKKQNREIALVFCKISNDNNTKKNTIEHDKKLKTIVKAISKYKNDDDIIVRYDRNYLATIFQNVNREQMIELITLISKKIQSDCKNSNIQLDVDFGYAMNQEFSTPIDFLMTAISN